MSVRPATVWLLLLASMIAGTAVRAADAAVDDVVVIDAGGTLMYKYRDRSGQVVVQDRPPLGYFEQLQATEETGRTPTTPIPLSIRTESPDGFARALATLGRWLPWVLIALGGYVLVVPALRSRLKEPALVRWLRRAGFAAFTDVDLRMPDGRETRIDCLARTPAGILVITTVRLRGRVSALSEARRWTLTTANDEQQIDSPLMSNAAKTRMVAELIGDVPAHGRVVNLSRAHFAAGVPTGLHQPAGFRESLRHFAESTVDGRSLDGAWRVLMRFPRSNVEHRRVFGVGWKAWLWRRRHLVTAGVLAAMAATSALAIAGGLVG